MNCILIKKGHVSIAFARSLAEADSGLEIIEYISIKQIFQELWKRNDGSKIYLHSPDFKFIFLTILFCKKFQFRYFLHEPYISFNRSPSILFWFGYHIWLFFIQFFCKFIFLSKNGMNSASKNFFLTKSSNFLGVLPIAINKKMLSDFKISDYSFDFIMWGSLNHEKGLDRFLKIARKLPDKSFAVMSKSNSYLQSLKETNSDLNNFKWFLSNKFIEDKEIFKFIASCKYAVMLQRESTQSGQLPLALALGKSVFASDSGAFPEFLDGAIFSKIFKNSSSDKKIVNDVILHIKKIAGDEIASQNEAKSIFMKHFDSQSSRYKNWSKNF